MKGNMEERAERLALYIIENRTTVRAAAAKFGISKSTVHKDISERLPLFNRALYLQVKEVLDVNKAQRHIRGGIATRKKYKGPLYHGCTRSRRLPPPKRPPKVKRCPGTARRSGSSARHAPMAPPGSGPSRAGGTGSRASLYQLRPFPADPAAGRDPVPAEKAGEQRRKRIAGCGGPSEGPPQPLRNVDFRRPAFSGQAVCEQF